MVYPLPIDSDFEKIDPSDGWLPTIRGKSKSEVIETLKQRWSFEAAPFLQSLADAIFRRDIACLATGLHGEQWLSFASYSESSLHIPPPTPLPSSLKERFPFSEIAGVEDLLVNFGGLVDGMLPPCPQFIPVSECRLVSDDCDLYDWGKTDGWEGSLPIYNTMSGNFIVLSGDNRCAKWDHDIGWETKEVTPFTDLEMNIDDLIEKFVLYIDMDDSDSTVRREYPFYY